MQPRPQTRALLMGALAAPALLLGSQSAWAVNPEFQDFFFDVCASPSGALAARCAETTGGLGNVSGDSESSLNPSQVLNVNASGLAAARARAKQARERADRLDDPVTTEVAGGPWSFLANIRFSGEEVDRRVDVSPERGHEQTGRSLELGFDRRLSPTAVLGLLFSYEETELDFVAEAPGNNFVPAARAGDIETEVYGVTGYGVFQLSDRAYLDAAIGYGWGDNEFTRNSVFQESGRQVPQTDVRTRATSDQTQLWGSINLGYEVLQGDWSATTYGGLQWTDTQSDAFTERDLNGSGLNMSFGEVDEESLIGLLGVQVQRVVGLTTGALLLQGRAEYLHQFEDAPPRAVARYALDTAGNELRLRGDDVDRDYFAIGLGMGWVLPNGWLPFVDAEMLAGYDNRDSYRITAGLRKEL